MRLGSVDSRRRKGERSLRRNGFPANPYPVPSINFKISRIPEKVYASFPVDGKVRLAGLIRCDDRRWKRRVSRDFRDISNCNVHLCLCAHICIWSGDNIPGCFSPDQYVLFPGGSIVHSKLKLGLHSSGSFFPGASIENPVIHNRSIYYAALVDFRSELNVLIPNSKVKIRSGTWRSESRRNHKLIKNSVQNKSAGIEEYFSPGYAQRRERDKSVGNKILNE
ncbi:hypothetical protein D1872_130250 [compost metagenome]